MESDWEQYNDIKKPANLLVLESVLVSPSAIAGHSIREFLFSHLPVLILI